MNIHRSEQGLMDIDSIISFPVLIYPARTPTPFSFTNHVGEKFDYYIVIDKKRLDNRYKRTIKINEVVAVINMKKISKKKVITQKMQKIIPYFKEVVDYINKTYPLAK